MIVFGGVARYLLEYLVRGIVSSSRPMHAFIYSLVDINYITSNMFPITVIFISVGYPFGGFMYELFGKTVPFLVIAVVAAFESGTNANSSSASFPTYYVKSMLLASRHIAAQSCPLDLYSPLSQVMLEAVHPHSLFIFPVFPAYSSWSAETVAAGYSLTARGAPSPGPR